MSKYFREYRTFGRTGLEVSRLGVASGYGITGKAQQKNICKDSKYGR